MLPFVELPPVALNLVALREHAKLTQEQLAAVTGVKQGNISRYETGESTPDLATVLKLAPGLKATLDMIVAGMNADYDRLIGRVDAPPPPAEPAIVTETIARLRAMTTAYQEWIAGIVRAVAQMPRHEQTPESPPADPQVTTPSQTPTPHQSSGGKRGRRE